MADVGSERSIDGALHDMAKVELHVHLEGSFTGERIAELAAEAGQEMPADPGSILACDSLPDLLARLDWWCGLVRTPEQAERQAHDFAVSMAADGIAYAEVIVNPTHWSGLVRPALLEAVSSGFARAAAEGGADCWLLVSLLRRQSGEEALAVVAELERRPPSRLVGLSIDGNEAETGPTGARFAPAFAAAGALGLGLTAHAGESSGAEGVTSALDDLGVSRIDHGIRIVEDPVVLEAHPLRRLVAAGVAVTINTDDPATLGVTLTGEMALAARHCGWGLAGAIRTTEQAISASFASQSTAAGLRRLLQASTTASS
jgi:adenosine deaminase